MDHYSDWLKRVNAEMARLAPGRYDRAKPLVDLTDRFLAGHEATSVAREVLDKLYDRWLELVNSLLAREPGRLTADDLPDARELFNDGVSAVEAAQAAIDYASIDDDFIGW